MAPGPLEAQATNPGLETKLPYIRDRKRSNLHSASWANQRPRPRTLPYWYTAFLLPLPRSLNFCLEGSAELAPEGGSPFQLNNKSSFVLDHILCFLLSNKHLFFYFKYAACLYICHRIGVGLVYTSAKSATKSTSSGNFWSIYKVGSHCLKSTKALKVKELWTKVTKQGGDDKSVSLLLKKGSQLLRPRAWLALQPKVTEAQGPLSVWSGIWVLSSSRRVG